MGLLPSRKREGLGEGTLPSRKRERLGEGQRRNPMGATLRSRSLP